MRFKSIWTNPTLSLGERFLRTRDWGARKIAAALPLRIRYWVTLQMIGNAVGNSPHIPATPLDDILRDLETPKNLH